MMRFLGPVFHLGRMAGLKLRRRIEIGSDLNKGNPIGSRDFALSFITN